MNQRLYPPADCRFLRDKRLSAVCFPLAELSPPTRQSEGPTSVNGCDLARFSARHFAERFQAVHTISILHSVEASLRDATFIQNIIGFLLKKFFWIKIRIV